MKPNQPQLPAMPRDFSQPVECCGVELAAVIEEARAAGFLAHRMTVLPFVSYELRFYRAAVQNPATRQPEATETAEIPLREPPKTEAVARLLSSPDSLQTSNKTFILQP